MHAGSVCYRKRYLLGQTYIIHWACEMQDAVAFALIGIGHRLIIGSFSLAVR